MDDVEHRVWLERLITADRRPIRSVNVIHPSDRRQELFLVVEEVGARDVEKIEGYGEVSQGGWNAAAAVYVGGEIVRKIILGPGMFVEYFEGNNAPPEGAGEENDR